jgi:hypothetical protein
MANRELAPLLTRNNLIKRVNANVRKLAALSRATVSANQASALFNDLGEQRAFDFLTAATGYPDDGTYTGSFLSANGYTFGTTWAHIGGVYNGTIRWGANAVTGRLFAGGEEVWLDEEGLSIAIPNTYGNVNSFKFVDGDDKLIVLQASKSSSMLGDDGILFRSVVYGTAAYPRAYHQLEARNYSSGSYPNRAWLILETFETDGGYGDNSHINLSTLTIGATAAIELWANTAGATTAKITADAIILDGTVTGGGSASSGTYTPTPDIANSTNVDSSGTVISECQWIRVGNVVTVSGYGTINPTANAQTNLLIPLPIASNFTDASDAAGTAKIITTVEPGSVYANAALDEIEVDFKVPGTTSSQPFTFHCMYKIK